MQPVECERATGGSVPESNEANNLTQSAQPVVVSGATILDNGQAGYSDAGGWSSAPLGYGGSLRYAAAGTGSATATWQANGLAPGAYLVQATWNGYYNHASNAPFSIYDGNTLLTTVATPARAIAFSTLRRLPMP